MEELDLLSVVLVTLGAVLVYGAVPILKLVNKLEPKKMLIMKLLGLLIAFAGFARILF